MGSNTSQEEQNNQKPTVSYAQKETSHIALENLNDQRLTQRDVLASGFQLYLNYEALLKQCHSLLTKNHCQKIQLKALENRLEMLENKHEFLTNELHKKDKELEKLEALYKNIGQNNQQRCTEINLDFDLIQMIAYLQSVINQKEKSINVLRSSVNFLIADNENLRLNAEKWWPELQEKMNELKKQETNLNSDIIRFYTPLINLDFIQQEQKDLRTRLGKLLGISDKDEILTTLQKIGESQTDILLNSNHITILERQNYSSRGDNIEIVTNPTCQLQNNQADVRVCDSKKKEDQKNDKLTMSEKNGNPSDLQNQSTEVKKSVQITKAYDQVINHDDSGIEKEVKDTGLLEQSNKVWYDLNLYNQFLQISSFERLRTEGWKIFQTEKFKESDKVYVSVFGGESSGKTFLLENITEKFRTSDPTKTEGLGICAFQNCFLIDTECYVKPYDLDQNSEGRVDYQKKKEFVISFLKEISDIIIYIVSEFTLLDQQNIEVLTRDFKKKIVIIHNFKNESSQMKCEKRFSSQIERYFDVTKRKYIFEQFKEFNRSYYVDKRWLNMTHLSFAKRSTEAGDYFNSSSTYFLKKLMFAITDTKRLNFLEAFYKTLRENISEIIENYEEQMLEKEPDWSKIKLKIERIKFKSLSSEHMRLIRSADIFAAPYELKLDRGSGILSLIIECPSLDINSVEVKVNRSHSEFEIAVTGSKAIMNKESKENVQSIENYRRNARFLFETRAISIYEFNIDEKILKEEYTDGNLMIQFGTKGNGEKNIQ